jgi:CHASE2 domain-containing sensor protein
MGAALTLFCGLALHQTPLGEKWENTSYDYLFRFGTYPTNDVVLVVMDNASYDNLQQSREGLWDRDLHRQLLDKLADDKSALVVFDVFFRSNSASSETDEALAAAIRRQGHVVLLEKTEEPQYTGARVVEARLPLKLFADAAAGLGIGEVDETLIRQPDQPPRRHWPFPSPSDLASLPWTAAVMHGARLPQTPAERWLRYYGENGNWTEIPYYLALSNNVPGFFQDKVVFIGQEPKKTDPNVLADDKFRTPYTRWNGKAVGGVEILATTYLNLVQGDWLRRPPEWVEAGLLVAVGVLFGAGLTLVRRWVACGLAVLGFLAIATVAVSLSYYTNYWFDWMTLAGGQLPCALAWAWFSTPLRRQPQVDTTIVLPRPAEPPPDRPETPDYQLQDKPFGSGAYGRVWLARNAIGQWQALKAVYMSGFGSQAGPYEREFNGITHYKPVSEKHPGLLRIDFVSQKKPAGYFYYVMELGDSLTPGWEKDPSTYSPKDLASVRDQAQGRRLPAGECIRICLALCDALDFLHRQGLTHRDIKPQNIIFVRGEPKLADVGLIAEIRTDPQDGTFVGTRGYMPPLPEPPGTPKADIYGLGMVLYVIRTGRDPDSFPGISTTLAEQTKADEFVPLNTVILKACQPDIAQRYASAAQMRDALREVQRLLDGG